MGLLEDYRTSVAAFADTVSKIRPDQWHAVTPCSEWDVRTLVNHIVSEQRWSVPLLAGSTIAEVGDRLDGDLLGADAIGAAARAAEDASAAASETGALERTVELSFGTTAAREYIHQLLADHLVHGWDLASAIGADRTMDPSALATCRAWFADQAQAYRGSGMIGPEVAVAPDASDQDRLIAAFGRDPEWSPPHR